MEGKPRNLIETVACDIATNILQDYREVKGLKISVQKPHVALNGVVKSMGEASKIVDGCSKGVPLSEDCLSDTLTIQGCAPSMHSWMYKVCFTACGRVYDRMGYAWCGCEGRNHSHDGNLSLASLRRCGDREVPLRPR